MTRLSACRLLQLPAATRHPRTNEQRSKETMKYLTNDHQQPHALTSPSLQPFHKIICHVVTFRINLLQ